MDRIADEAEEYFGEEAVNRHWKFYLDDMSDDPVSERQLEQIQGKLPDDTDDMEEPRYVEIEPEDTYWAVQAHPQKAHVYGPRRDRHPSDPEKEEVLQWALERYPHKHGFEELATDLSDVARGDFG